MEYNEKKLRKYIEKCFRDSFKAENRNYNELWGFEWIMIKNSAGMYQLYPIIQCKYERVVRRVGYRLKNNLMKNFGIQYGNTDKMRCLLEYGSIDFNFTQAMFSVNKRNMVLNVFDKKTNPYENGLSGECMIAYTYEKLLFKYWNIDANIYNTLPNGDEKKRLPSSLKNDWEAFKSLYNEAFETPIGSYDIICSSGVKQL